MIADVEEAHLYLLGVPNDVDGDAFEASLEGDPRIAVAATPWPRPSRRCPFLMVPVFLRGAQGTVRNQLKCFARTSHNEKDKEKEITQT